MKSIRGKITFWIVLLSVLPAFSIALISGVMSYITNMEKAQNEIVMLAEDSAKRIRNRLDAYLNVAEVSGATFDLTFNDFPDDYDRQKAMMDGIAADQNFVSATVIDSDGIGRYDGQDYSQRAAFNIAMSGQSYVSDPIQSLNSNEVTSYFVAPIWANGEVGSEVIGVARYSSDCSLLSEVVESVHVEGVGRGYIVNGDGLIVAFPEQSVIESQYNVIEQSKGDSRLSKYLEYMQDAANNVELYGEYYSTEFGEDMLICTRNIEINANSWSLIVEVPKSHYMESLYTTIWITIIMVVIFVIVGIFIAILVSGQISKPIVVCCDRIKALACGDVTSPVEVFKHKDETGVLSSSTSDLVKNLNRIITDIERILSAMAEGKLNVETDQNANSYVGDFAELLSSVKTINRELSSAMGRIEVAADQVSAGSDQVSAGAQGLSQGATEQASSIEELAATITEISSKTDENLSDCIKAKDSVSETTALMTEANTQMKNMTEAMDRINVASAKIEKIIKAIEDIAFQTNILALNAAVEAAKAGEAGKGFAVVAEEVRNLAAKSQDAVKSTASLIGESSNAVQDGIRISGETASTLDKVMVSANEVNEIVSKVAEASEMQSVSIQQVTVGIDQISSVVQNNSATAQESAAASEELNSQAQLLKSLVAKFEIDSGDSGIELV